MSDGLERFLMRLASRHFRNPLARAFLRWRATRHFAAMGPMSHLGSTYMIPDLDRPILEDRRGPCGPSAHLVPFDPPPLREADVVGRAIDEVLTHVGCYGMGGPGYFGLRLGAAWLVVAISGAGEWIEVDGRLVEDGFHEIHNRPPPWIGEGVDRLGPKLVGTRIAALDVRRHALTMTFSNGMTLRVHEAPERRPTFQGNGSPRAFLDGDDLRKAVFLAPTAEIWVE